MAILKIDPADLQDLASEHSLVFVDFWATWCPPCRNFGPIFEAASNAPENSEFAFVKVDVDEYQEFASVNGISSIPTIWVFKNGEKVYGEPGSLNAEGFAELIGKYRI